MGSHSGSPYFFLLSYKAFPETAPNSPCYRVISTS